MNIGLDYGQVISQNLPAFKKLVSELKKNGHIVYLVSHTFEDDGVVMRGKLCVEWDMVNLSFKEMVANDIPGIKAQKVKDNYINLYVDDVAKICECVAQHNPKCVTITMHPSQWQITVKLLYGLCA